jgi:hypothetical protein
VPPLLFSASGRRVVVTSASELIVHDLEANEIKLRVALDIPVLLTDTALVTLSEYGGRRVYQYD